MFIPINTIKHEMINYFGKDIKRINHALKVHSFAQLIATSENVDTGTNFIIEAASLLHDIGIKQAEAKYNSSAGKYQELEGPPEAKRLLAPFHLEATVLNRILYLIGNHHSYHQIDGIDFQILVESDLLVNAFEDELPLSSLIPLKEKYIQTQLASALMTQMFI